MPGLIAFRRRWSTGSDDLVVPGFLLFTLHVILFIIISILIGSSSDLEYYSTLSISSLENSVPRNQTLIDRAVCAHEIRDYTIGYLVLIAIAAVIELFMACFSMQGTILEPEPRKPVTYFIYLRMTFGLIEMAFSILSAARISTHWSRCGAVEDLNKTQIGIVVINVIVFLIVILVGYCVFDPTGREYYDVKSAYDQEGVSTSRIERMRKELDIKSRKTWLTRLSNCFCCVSNNSTNIKQVALDEVSTLLHNFFKDYDFVPSDIIAGLTLLRHKQQRIQSDKAVSNSSNVQEFMSGRPITADTAFVDLGDQVTRKECEDMAYYCVYGLAAYGPLFYWIENTGTGLCGIMKECLCGKNPTFTSTCCLRHRVSRRKRTLVRGDDGCGWALAGIRKSLREHGVGAEIVYASLENDVSKQPFFVCVDHEMQTVVVSVRGTLAEADALTDLVASADFINTEENDGTWKAHKGMLNGAEFIKNKLLQQDMVLSLGFGHCLARGTPSYNLVLVGHSLGAGIATILAILLHPIYPRLKCYAFSPPGGLLSHSAMLASREFVHTLIFGKDIVPRAGIPQLESLRNEVVDLLKHTDLPKYKIILGNLCGSLTHRHKLLRSERWSSRAIRVTSRRLNSGSADTAAIELVEPLSEELFPPGKIYHLVYSKEKHPRCGGRKKVKKKYHLVHADNTTDFGEIIVSHQMISHHLPQEVLRCMRKAVKNFSADRVNRSYAQSATLPFTENLSNSMQKAKQQKADNNMGTSTSDPCRISIESPSRDSDVPSDTSGESLHPLLNTNHNSIVSVVTDMQAITVSSSSSTSSSSLPDITAPLARPESFRLSISAQSPVSPVNTFHAFRDGESSVVANERIDSDASASLLTTVPQASSTPFLTSKVSTMESAKSVSFSDQVEDQDDSSLSCDDVNIDAHGTNAAS